MSKSTEIDRVCAALEESARLAGTVCDRANVLPVLQAFGDDLPHAMIVFGVQAGTGHVGELDYSFTVPATVTDPYPHALAHHLTAPTDHPVASLLAEVRDHWPVAEYFVDAGIVGGFKKLYAHFPQHLQKVSDLTALDSVPDAVAANADLFARHGLDQIAMIGVDYRHRTMSLYFHFGPGGQLTPDTLGSLLREAGMPEARREVLQFAHTSLRGNITLGWDSPDILRIAFAPPPVRGLDPAALPGRTGAHLEAFARRAPRRYDGEQVNLFAVKWVPGEEYLEMCSYYQLSALQRQLLTTAPHTER
ncbi:aromatic prenyltransferase [Streptomyces sp. NPDC048182]|uniref:aromatic prenyltransferase n=1 Tax=unclassified Streptomyces TaxID=2593676 RepID=UPI0033B5FD11